MKKNNILLCLIFSVLLYSCYGINEKNSYFFTLSTCCAKDAWIQILNEHKVENVENKDVINILKEFRNQPFPTDVIYFKDYPEEYIGISENYQFVRYVYNKKLSNEVLDGFSEKLKNSEKIRIGLRINALLMSRLSEEGRKESIILIRKECDNYLKDN